MHDTNIPMSHTPFSVFMCYNTDSRVRQLIHLMLLLMISAVFLKSSNDAVAMAAVISHSLTANISWWCLCSRVHMLVVRGLPEMWAQELAWFYCSMWASTGWCYIFILCPPQGLLSCAPSLWWYYVWTSNMSFLGSSHFNYLYVNISW